METAPAMEGLSEEFIRKNEKYLKIIQNFRLLDDDFMSKVFEDKACADLLLQIILERDDLIVREVHGQYDIKNLQGRSVRLDILAVDQTGRTYNVEIQRQDKGADAHRARYNSTLLDANLTNPGDEYDALGETYVIFITERDVLKDGLPIYHIDRIIRETGKSFEDGSHIIYVNAQSQSDTPLGKLMRDFHCKQAKDMHYPTLANRVRYFKENEEGATNMCRAVENLVKEERHEAMQQGVEKGRETERLDMIRALMKNMNLTYEQAVKGAGIPESEWTKYKELLAKAEK